MSSLRNPGNLLPDMPTLTGQVKWNDAIEKSGTTIQ